MADFMDFSITKQGARKIKVSLRIVDSETQQTTLLDLTGSNGFVLPDDIAALTDTQVEQYLNFIAREYIRIRWGY